MRQYIPRRYPSVLFSGLPLLLTMILMLSPTAVQSQSASATGRLEGIVTDSSGAAVPGADITVRNQNTGISTTLQSAAEGDFTFLLANTDVRQVGMGLLTQVGVHHGLGGRTGDDGRSATVADATTAGGGREWVIRGV